MTFTIETPGKPAGGTRRAFLVGVALPALPLWLAEEHLDELAELARAAGVEVAGTTLQRRRSPDSRLFIGGGKAEEIAEALPSVSADLVVFDDDLSPSQLKNLEKIFSVQVMDRSGLILEIFHQRARTREARTQVELARLEYLLPRLTRLWTHLSRQAGHSGVRGGAGEKQLEVDRRMLRTRIAGLKKDLRKIERTRELQRRGRRNVPTVALAGYTNAGKSTLFNRLTQSDAKVKDLLFATLDSRLRQGAVAEGRVVVFGDTVGFIRKLPHHLVASFRSTLEEVTEADVVLHVIDRSNPRWEEQVQVAAEVLTDLGVEDDRILTVHNKVDRLSLPAGSFPDAIRVSARTGAGIDELKVEIAQRLDDLAAVG